MSDAIIDETILNDDNEEELDYDLDPSDEIALLQEDEEQNLEEDDILDLNTEDEQMDVTDEKIEISLGKVNNQKNLKAVNNGTSLTEKNVNRIPKISSRNDKFNRDQKATKQAYGRGNIPRNRPIRRSKTVLINPRFHGPFHVNSRPLAWETPPAIINESQKNQQYIQPWVTGSVPPQSLPSQQVPFNNFNPSAFAANNQNPLVYMPPQQFQQQQLHTQQMQPQQIQPQVLIQPQQFQPQVQQPVHQPFLQQQTVQTNQYPSMFNYQPPPPIQITQQVPPQETPKLPVHLRLGVPNTNTNNFSQPSNNVMPYDNNQNQYNNHLVTENQNFNQFPPPPFTTSNHMVNVERTHPNNQYANNQFVNNHAPFNKQNRNVSGNVYNNNNKVVPIRKPRMNMPNQKNMGKEVGKTRTFVHQVVKQEVKEEGHKVVDVNIPDDEDEETREYRKKIQEQAKKREEILRKKEESRLKNLSQQENNRIVPNAVPKPVNRPVYQQKKFKHQNRPQQQNLQLKSQNYTNNIVLIDNDSQSHFGQRYKKTLRTLVNDQAVNVAAVAQPERIVYCSDTNISVQTRPEPSAVTDIKPEVSSEFLSNRSVLVQNEMPSTNIVVVKNLASATNEPKIMKLCREVGKVQKLQMEKKDRQAIIHFNTVASAHAFYNKFRRHMIDLSIIQVDLVPCEGSS